MKTYYIFGFRKALLLFLVLNFTISFGQTLFEFNFENGVSPSLENVVGTPSFTTKGLNNEGFNRKDPCQGGKMFMASNWTPGDSYGFTVNTTGYSNMAFSFCGRASDNAMGTFLVRVSSDGGISWTSVLSSFTPTTSNMAFSTGIFPASANNAGSVLIEIMKVSAAADQSIFLIDSATLTANPEPAIAFFSTTTVCIGSSFIINGIYLFGATAVTINGMAVSSFVVNSPTSITAVVGAGNSSGLVEVSNAYGSGGSSILISVLSRTTWTGAESGYWSEAGNWSCGAVPGEGNDVVIPAMSNQPVVSSEAYAHSLTLETGATLVVLSGFDLYVTDVINNAGILTLENNSNLIQINNVRNTGTGSAIVHRNSATVMRLDYTLWSSPVDGLLLESFSPLTLENRFYTYNPMTDLYEMVVAPSTTYFEAGKGYLIRMPNNHPTVPTSWEGIFAGTLHNGNVNVTLVNDAFNAVGNPYPSTIDADAFIIDNRITEALYFWRKTNNPDSSSYATYTLAGETGTASNPGDTLGLVPNGIIQVGQGFIVKPSLKEVVFTNSMRVGNHEDQFLRNSAQNRSRIWLNLTGADGGFSQAMVAYMPNATSGIDASIDGRVFNDSKTGLTSIIDKQEFVIQGRALPFDQGDVVALGFKSEFAGHYTIALDHGDGLFALGQKVYIKDHLTNITHDLSSGNYSFVSEAGVFNSRFEIVYRNVLAVEGQKFGANSLVVYKQGPDLVVNSGSAVMSEVKVFDVSGRLLVDKKNIGVSECMLNAGLARGVLLVQVWSEDNEIITKKVIK